MPPAKLKAKDSLILSRMLDDVVYAEIAKEVGVSEVTIKRFAQKHQTELAALRERRNEATADLWITDKRKVSELLQRQTARLWRDYKTAEGGRDKAAMAREITSSLQLAARMNDMLPRGGVNLSVDARNQSVTLLDSTRLPPEEVARLTSGKFEEAINVEPEQE